VKNERNICVTGGEPLLQKDVYELLNSLLKEGKNIVLETNGSIDISKVPADKNLMISMDIKCPSSSMSEKMNMSNIQHLKPTDQLKFIIGDGSDLEYAVSFIESYDIRCNIIFSPVGGMDIEPLTEEVVDRNLNVRVLPQLHKLIWGNKRSV
jgi:7-carboxy-7-deazaguanine synthase